MNVQRRNDVAIYCLSSGPVLPEWIGERARRNLSKKDESIRRRIELIQDFQMPAASSRIVQSADGRYIIAAGTYPPRIRCYDLHELTMKFERYMNAEVIDIIMLGEDYGKMALLQDDRTIAFHAPYGAHESIRIPTFGRAMAYEPTTCELLVAAKGNQVYRLTLDEGRFQQPWSFLPSEASGTCISVNRAHPLAAVGCDNGTVQFWDSRSSDTLKPFLKLDVQSATAGFGYADHSIHANTVGISSIAQDQSGLHMAVGTAGGVVALYDVRSSKPLHVKEHKHGLPIHTVKFHPASGMVLSGDEKLIKSWRYKTSSDVHKTTRYQIENNSSSLGAVQVNIESTGGKLSHFIMAGDEYDPCGEKSGLLLCASDQPKMETYYLPALGAAPKWCSFLESITEELEERELERDGSGGGDLVRDGQEAVYENYKFIGTEEVEKLGISNLVGTPLLRAYMHGFFMDINLYNRVKAVANPFEYEEYQKKKVKERLEAKRASRIAPRASEKKKRAVNPDLAERLEHKSADTTKSGKVAKQLLSDDRFGTLFTNPDFRIDEDAEDFKLRNPSGIAAAKHRANNLDSDDEHDDDDDDELANAKSLSGKDNSDESAGHEDSSDSDSDGFDTVRGEAYESMKAKKSTKSTKKPKKKAIMKESEELDGKSALLGLGDGDAAARSQRLLDELNMPLAQRLAKTKEETTIEVRVEGGSKEATFIPKADLKKMEAEAKRQVDDVNQKRKRRGVKELGLKKPFKHIK